LSRRRGRCLFPYTTLFRSLVFRRVLLGIGLQDGALFLPCLRQRHGVGALWRMQHPSNEAIFTFPNRSWCTFPTHGTVNGFDRHLDRKSTRLNSSHVSISYA